jgi:hypothetical protein
VIPQNEQDSVGNEENRYPVPDLNKTLLNVTKELSDTAKAVLRGKFRAMSAYIKWTERSHMT